MIKKRELRKLATLQISAIIQSMDLAQLFGDELYDLGHEDGGEWVHDYLTQIQVDVATRIIPKLLQ